MNEWIGLFLLPEREREREKHKQEQEKKKNEIDREGYGGRQDDFIHMVAPGGQDNVYYSPRRPLPPLSFLSSPLYSKFPILIYKLLCYIEKTFTCLSGASNSKVRGSKLRAERVVATGAVRWVDLVVER
jgi:hypothetical protein